MNTPKISRSILFLIVAALFLSACNNTMASQPGVWYNPFSWGDKTAAQTAEEILQSAQDAKTIREAQAAATAMAGGVTPTNVVQPTDVVLPTTAPTLVSTLAAPATLVPATTVPAQPISCDLDKIGTWSETSSSSPYRIEVGGHGIEAFDFYPVKDVKAISYIVDTIEPNQTPAIWHGFGSAWEGQCLDYDYVADATRYAQARLDSGHSGLVIDMRDGKFSIVANVSNMTQAQIDALLALHKAAMDPTAK